MTDLREDGLDAWRKSLEQARAERSWAEYRLRDEKRIKIAPEIRGLIEGFTKGEIDLVEFKETFDQKTRDEWDVFGLKGLSGAMFLNQLAKYVPNQAEITDRLRRILKLPVNAEEGERKMRDLHSYLAGLREQGLVGARQVQPSFVPFFVSACWHMSDFETWPIYYGSARNALRSGGLFEPSDDIVASYFRFREVFSDLRSKLGLSPWDMEHLCVSRSEPEELPITPLPTRDEVEPQVWLVAPGKQAEQWEHFYRDGVIAIGWSELGDLSRYSSLDEIKEALSRDRHDGVMPVNDALACHDFSRSMKLGDRIFAKKGRYKIVGHGTIQSDYIYDPSRSDYPNVRKVAWDKKGEWTPREEPLVTKTVTEIGKYPSLVAQIERALGIDAGQVTDPKPSPEYTIEQAAAELFLPRERIEFLVNLLRDKKNVVLQGPPGVGKTFVASRLADLLAGSHVPEQICSVQFHQSYSYEDFVQGYRPTENGGFARKDGPFMRFCDRALQDTANPYVLIIDEINRGNLSKILGELMMLIEPDKRSKRWAVQLTYSAEGEPPFYVPPNIYIIGTMNTADRSLAIVDYAVRRRFAFVDVEPAFDSPAFLAHLQRSGIEENLRERIIRKLQSLNAEIVADSSLGRGFCVGHSYFCSATANSRDDAWYERVINTEIEPLLREYWFDKGEHVDDAVASLLSDE